MTKSVDNIFIYSSIVFNISVSGVYVVTKLGNMILTQVFGVIVIFLIVPFLITLLGYVKEKEKKKTVVSNGIILFYLFLELVLDYILKSPFREILGLHVPYIIVFYATLFSMIDVSLEKNKRLGYFVVATFFILMACLIYNLLPA